MKSDREGQGRHRVMKSTPQRKKNMSKASRIVANDEDIGLMAVDEDMGPKVPKTLREARNSSEWPQWLIAYGGRIRSAYDQWDVGISRTC